MGLAIALVALAGCTPSEPERSTGPEPATTASTPTPTPTPTPVAELRTPIAPSTVLDPDQPGVTASRQLFTSAPVVVLAPGDDPEAQAGAASAAVALDAPVLLVPAPPEDPDPASDETASPTESAPDETATASAQPRPAWRAELARLAPEVVLAVGLSDAQSEGTATRTLEPGQVATLLGLPVAEYQPDELLAAVQSLDRDAPVALEPADEEDASTPQTSPDGASAAAPAPLDLPPLARADPVTGAALLTDGDPSTLAAVATARAVGLPVVTVPPDPRTSAAAVDRVASVVGPETRVLAAGPGFADYATAEDLDWRVRTAATGVQLPGGGQTLFPGRRIVALYGTPGTAGLGVLGEQGLTDSVERAQWLARRYQKLDEETVVPGFEIIATVASAGAGDDGDYSRERRVSDLRPWVERAEEEGIYVILDLQPGRTDFLTQAQRYEELLTHPNVGLALDPEWRLEPDQRHLRQIGSVDIAEVNEVAAWLAALTREHRLPQKALVLHQFAPRMIRDRDELDTSHPELATIIHVDGQGTQAAKAGTWAAIRRDAPANVHWGWKNFVDEDKPTLTAVQTMQIEPVPDLITYQ